MGQINPSYFITNKKFCYPTRIIRY